MQREKIVQKDAPAGGELQNARAHAERSRPQPQRRAHGAGLCAPIHVARAL